MASNYGFERGKYGVFPGTIIAFSRTLDGNDPNNPDFKNYIPAGFLRCDGSILPGVDYPNLKDILGVGQNSKFRKEGTTLEEDVPANTSGGTFQLPDLGSKYVRASSASGVYAGTTVANPVNDVDQVKVGIGTDITLNRGTTFDINYSGNLTIPQFEIDYLNNQNFSTTLGVVLDEVSVNDTSYLTHSHFSVLPGWMYDNNENYSAEMSISDISPTLSALNTVDIIGQVTVVTGEQENAVHQHVLEREFPNRETEALIPNTSVDGFAISTEVTLREQGTIKMDDLAPSFILVEYLIKF